jgi:hypothetical protein
VFATSCCKEGLIDIGFDEDGNNQQQVSEDERHPNRINPKQTVLFQEPLIAIVVNLPELLWIVFLS